MNKIYTTTCRNKTVIDMYHNALQSEDPTRCKPVGATYGEILDYLLDKDIVVTQICDRTFATRNNVMFYPQLTYRTNKGYSGINQKEYLLAKFKTN